MAEKGQPPLLLFPPSEGLAPQLVPVPATASLFPTEDGEADSFLGQSDTPPTDLQQPQQGMTFPFLQQQPSPQPDPFTQQVPSMQPPPVDQPLPPPQTQYYSPQQFASPPPPPTGEHQQDQSLFGSRRPQRVFAQTQPTISQSTGSLPPTAPPPTTGFSQKPMFDPSKPPPTSTDFQQMRSPAMAESQGAVASGSPQVYTPVQGHWFYSKLIEQRSVWLPFTMADALKLEDALATVQQDPDDCIIQTDGGRYDVDLRARLRSPVYWEEESTEVRRCTWFYKGDGDNRFIPYEEAFAEKLEQEFQFAVTNNVWHRRLEFPDGETVVMHNPNVIVHFRPSTQADEWGAATQDSSMRPRVVKRGMDDDVGQVEEGEPNLIDHVMFVVHGIGPVCDLRFRSIVECVDDFRSVSLSLLQSHFGHHQDEGKVGRVEFLPVSWHSVLHGDATGVDRRLRNITLPSIGRLRHFTNDTLLDILFYSSPLYCQTVSDRVGGEINRLYQLFRERNPAFCGKMSIIGHSLGSLICFDLLSHQHDPNAPVHLPEESPPQVQTTRSMPDLEADSVDALDVSVKPEPLPSLEDSLKQLGLSDFIDAFKKEQIDMETLTMCSESDIKEMGLPMGPRKKLMSFVKAQAAKQEERKQELVKQEAEKAARLAARRVEQEMSRQQRLDSSMQDSSMSVHVDYTPGLKGTGQPFVKYPQLDFLPSCFFALGSPIGMFLTVRGVETVGDDFKLPTCDALFNIFHPFDPVAYRIEPLINKEAMNYKPVLMPHHKGRKRLHLELKESLSTFGADLKRGLIDSMKKTWKTIHEFAISRATTAEPTEEEMEKIADQLEQEQAEKQSDISSSESFEFLADELKLGILNKGNRIDYVLQEKPIESFNEYLFALGSHACYWESEDTVLMILKEVYALHGILPQAQGPDKKRPSQTPPKNPVLPPP